MAAAADELPFFSTEAADQVFLNTFVIAASARIESGNYQTAYAMYVDLGESWCDVERALIAMDEGAHEPAEDTTLEEYCKFAVEHSLGLLWQALKPKLRVRKVPLNMERIEAAYGKAKLRIAEKEAAMHPAQRH